MSAKGGGGGSTSSIVWIGISYPPVPTSMRLGTIGYLVFGRSALLMRSYALRRLVALGGEGAAGARVELERDWADAEPEFRATVAQPLLRSGICVDLK